VEQHTPYLMWICLSVHNRSHSMEQPSLRNVGLDERSLRKAVGLIFRSAGRQHGGHCPSPGLSCAETFADCSRPLVSKPSRGLREKRSLLRQTAFFFRSTPTHPFWSQGLASTLLLRGTCVQRPEQMKLNSRNQC